MGWPRKRETESVPTVHEKWECRVAESELHLIRIQRLNFGSIWPADGSDNPLALSHGDKETEAERGSPRCPKTHIAAELGPDWAS